MRSFGWVGGWVGMQPKSICLTLFLVMIDGMYNYRQKKVGSRFPGRVLSILNINVLKTYVQTEDNVSPV